MTISMSPPISTYFAADSRDGETVAECFTNDATVRDEGMIHVGRASIRNWKVNSSRKFSYSVAPFAIDSVDGQVVVTATVTGSFPGSPIDLRYFFTIDGNKIAALEIKL